MIARPVWTVCFNIVTENSRWIGTGKEFFDDEAQATMGSRSIPADTSDGSAGPVGAPKRDQPVTETDRDMKGLAEPQLTDLGFFAIVEEFEIHATRQHHDRLVLDAVVLERECLTGLDVKDLANVPIGLGPDQLVAPWL